MVDTFHKQGVRVIFWITQMIDQDSPNYAEGKAKGYYLKSVGAARVLRRRRRRSASRRHRC